MDTTINTPELRLSLEEVVVLLNLMGQPQLARETLHALVGPIGVEEERGRLLAANRALLARSAFVPTDDGMQIDPAITRLLAPLVDNHFVLRCTAREPGQPEQVLTYYIKDDLIIEQRIEFDVAHTFREMGSLTAASTACELLLGLTSFANFKAESFSLSDYQLNEVRRLVIDGVDQAMAYLRDLGLEDQTAALFVVDLTHQYRRGSAVRLEIDMAAGAVRDAGFLSLVGESRRAWLFTAQANEDSPVVFVTPADLNLVRQSMALALMPLAEN